MWKMPLTGKEDESIYIDVACLLPKEKCPSAILSHLVLPQTHQHSKYGIQSALLGHHTLQLIEILRVYSLILT